MLLTNLELLATVSDLADETGRTLDLDDAQALRVLADASALFRSVTGQQITVAEEDGQELTGTWERTLRLPQLPVNEITSASLRCPGELLFTEISDYTAPTRRGKLYRSGGWGGPDGAVQVIYSHGFTDVPDDVRATVLSIAARGLGAGERTQSNPNAVHELQIDTYRVVYESASDDPSRFVSGLTTLESSVLEKYRAWTA